MVKPIMLYGSEIWGYNSVDVLEWVQLRFFKILLKVHKSTPNVMVYGELGSYPLHLSIQVRMLSFWHKIVTSVPNKMSTLMYKLLYHRFCNNDYTSIWLSTIKNILDNVGLSHIWLNQGSTVSTCWLKNYSEAIIN